MVKSSKELKLKAVRAHVGVEMGGSAYNAFDIDFLRDREKKECILIEEGNGVLVQLGGCPPVKIMNANITNLIYYPAEAEKVKG